MARGQWRKEAGKKDGNPAFPVIGILPSTNFSKVSSWLHIGFLIRYLCISCHKLILKLGDLVVLTKNLRSTFLH